MKKLILTGIAGLMAFNYAQSQTVVSSDVTANATWSGTVVLDGPIHVKNGATLTISQGTIVRGQPRSGPGLSGAPGSLIITQNGKINAQGSSLSPIIFTTAAIENVVDGIPDGSGGYLTKWTPGDSFYDANPASNPLPPFAAGPLPYSTGNGPTVNKALWGGLIILGEAPTNLGTSDNATSQVGNIEGLDVSADTEFGGPFVNDNSGVLRYVSVRHGGDVLGSANEINGVTFGGVGRGTIVDHVEVYLTYDDGFEWFGGTVDATNLMSTFQGDDAFDGDQGFSGNLQFCVAVMPFFAIGDEDGDRSCEFDGNDSDLNFNGSGVDTQASNYTIANLTIVGPTGTTGNVNAGGGEIVLRNGFSGRVLNTIMVNVGTDQILTDQTANWIMVSNLSYDAQCTGTLTTDNSNNTGFFPVGVTTNQISNITTSPAFSGLVSEDANVVNGLNLRPAPSFGNASNLTSLQLGLPLEVVTYRGAVDPSASTAGHPFATWTALSLRGILAD